MLDVGSKLTAQVSTLCTGTTKGDMYGASRMRIRGMESAFGFIEVEVYCEDQEPQLAAEVIRRLVTPTGRGGSCPDDCPTYAPESARRRPRIFPISHFGTM